MGSAPLDHPPLTVRFPHFHLQIRTSIGQHWLDADDDEQREALEAQAEKERARTLRVCNNLPDGDGLNGAPWGVMLISETPYVVAAMYARRKAVNPTYQDLREQDEIADPIEPNEGAF